MLTFRPHHFLCALCFKGKGYSRAFITNFQTIMQHLNAKQGNQIEIKVTSSTDAICHPCPHRIEKICQSEEKITALDRAHADALQIQAGDIVTWGEAKKRIQQNISLETFHQICQTCPWKKLGICETVLSTFLLA